MARAKTKQAVVEQIVEEEVEIVEEQLEAEPAIYVYINNEPFDRFYMRDLKDKCEAHGWDINAVKMILDKPFLQYDSGRVRFELK